MYSPLSIQDLQILEGIIKEQKGPILMETLYGKVALLITEAAKLKYTEKGYIAITLSELRDWLIEIKDFQKQKKKLEETLQQLKEQNQITLSTLQSFEGKLTMLKRGQKCKNQTLKKS